MAERLAAQGVAVVPGQGIVCARRPASDRPVPAFVASAPAAIPEGLASKFRAELVRRGVGEREAASLALVLLEVINAENGRAAA